MSRAEKAAISTDLWQVSCISSNLQYLLCLCSPAAMLGWEMVDFSRKNALRSLFVQDCRCVLPQGCIWAAAAANLDPVLSLAFMKMGGSCFFWLKHTIAYRFSHQAGTVMGRGSKVLLPLALRNWLGPGTASLRQECSSFPNWTDVFWEDISWQNQAENILPPLDWPTRGSRHVLHELGAAQSPSTYFSLFQV